MNLGEFNQLEFNQDYIIVAPTVNNFNIEKLNLNPFTGLSGLSND